MEVSSVSSNQSIKLSSTGASDGTNEQSERHPSIETRVCLIGSAINNEKLIKQLKELNIPYLTSTDGMEYAEEDDPYYETVFIMDDFDGKIFDTLKSTDNRILGAPVIGTIVATNEPLPYTSRPLYCTCMQGLNLCFTNFKTKEHLAHLVTLCHYMGACIRKDMSSKIDYLVTNTLHGPKYRTAVSLGTAVMKEEWIHRCWAARHRDEPCKATDDEFLVPCKSKPFEGCTLSFLGFSDHEKSHMEEQTRDQGGLVADAGDLSCTHLVVEESTVTSLPFQPQGKLYIVVQEWFWGSIQIEAKAAESMYIFERVEYPARMTRSSTTSSLLGTPKWRGSTSGLSMRSTRASAGKTSFSRKRSRLREETLAKLAQETNGENSRQLPPRKRQSTDTSACIPDSMLDMSCSTTTSVLSPQTPDNVFKRGAENRGTNISSILHRVNHAQAPKHISTVRRKICRNSRNTPPMNVEISSVVRLEKRLQQRKDDTEKNRSLGNLKVHEMKPYNCNVKSQSKLATKRKGEDLKATVSQTEVSDFKTPLATPPPCKKSGTRSFKRRKRLSLSVDTLQVSASGVVRRLSLFTTGHSRSGENNPEFSLNEENQTVNTSFEPIEEEEDIIDEEQTSSPAAIVTARYQVAMELLQTEKNYVGILHTILNLFKKPLDAPNQAGGPILASEDVKAIFGSLPEIELVHQNMSKDLQNVMQQWNDTTCIGQIVLKYAEEIGRCYPPFVNFFESSLETITRCESRSSRFHAFLKINHAKRECGRQTLAELLINPVQRVPRIILLLQDIKKHTERENSDHPDISNIQSSIDALKKVMTYINEDKRKTESQKQIFDIVYEVEGCPPTIVSSHRQFVARAEMIVVDDNLCNKGDHISLFVFSDCIEVAKRRRGMKSQSMKSPNVHARPPSAIRCLKHIKLMSLSHIKKVVNINDSEDCQNAISLFCRTPTDTQDWLYTFKVMSCSQDSTNQSKEDESNSNDKENDAANVGKSRLLRLLSKHRANTMCKAIDDNFICSVNSHELDVCTVDLGSTLGRAVRAAKKSSRKLTRAFSFSRTPRRVVQRAVGNMLSPSQQRPPIGLSRADSTTSRDTVDDDEMSDGTGLTPSMSVASLCTPQRDRRGNRLGSTSSLQFNESKDFVPLMKPSVSTMTLARPPTAADMAEFPAVPTPPVRRRKTRVIKAATVAFGRTASFRKRVKTETAV